MKTLQPIDIEKYSFDIFRDLSVVPHARKPGPPERIDGMTLGIVRMDEDAPHGGEVHPDGDEILYIISGRVRVSADTAAEPLELGPGDACIVRQGQWHQVSVLEPAQLLHVTPGPQGDHRPLEVE